MEKPKYNNHEIKEVTSFRYLGSRIVANGSITEEIIEIIENAENFTI
jgi:hypothetical protein